MIVTGPSPPYLRALSTRFARTCPTRSASASTGGRSWGAATWTWGIPGDSPRSRVKSARSRATSTRVRRRPRLACSSWVRSRSSSTSRLSRVAACPIRSTERRCAAGSRSRSRRLSTYPPMSASGVRSSCDTAARKLARSSSAASSARRSRSTTTAPGSRPAIALNDAATGTSVPSSRRSRISASTMPDGPSSTSSNRQRGPQRRPLGAGSPSDPMSQPRSSRQVPAPSAPVPAEQRRRGAVHADDPALVVHGDDPVVRAVEDRREERLLAGERVAELGRAERDRELVADEREEADPVRRQRGTLGRPERDEAHRPRPPARRRSRAARRA